MTVADSFLLPREAIYDTNPLKISNQSFATGQSLEASGFL
jgi:hypothetical protein